MRESAGVTREENLNHAAFDGWQKFSQSSRGLAVMFLWAFAEATFFPVAPDGLLIPMAAAGRGRYWKIFGAGMLGMVTGGISIYLFAFFQPQVALAILPHLPLVAESMIRNASAVLDARGVFAFLTQPLSGISYKIFAILGGARGLNPLIVLPLSALARGLRMFSVSAFGALVVGRFPRFARDFWIYLLLTYVLLFGFVWFATLIMP